MGGGHHHHHGDGGGAAGRYGRAFAVGIGLNLGFVAIEAACGLAADSMALIADAGHNLSDVLGLAVAWGAYRLARRPVSERFTYGLRGSSILAALFNALFLLVACGAIAWEAVRRFGAPPPVEGMTLIWVAAAGIAVNLATALMFARDAKHDLNIRGAFLHMAADAAVSAGVVAAGVAVAATGQAWIDPAASLVIVAVIVAGTWGLLREATALALAGVPRGIDPAAVRALIAGLPGVARVHHLHIWPISTTEAALTAHLEMPAGGDDAFLHDAAARLRDEAGIAHATLQVERGACGEAC